MKGYCTLNSDASVKGNVGGYAVWIVSDKGRIKHYGRFKAPVDDANKAEIMAVINGLHLILKHELEVSTLVINTDNACCRFVINERKIPANNGLAKLAKRLMTLCKRFPVVYAKEIKGHSKLDTARHHVNRWCDEYARKGRLGIKM